MHKAAKGPTASDILTDFVVKALNGHDANDNVVDEFYNELWEAAEKFVDKLVMKEQGDPK